MSKYASHPLFWFSIGIFFIIISYLTVAGFSTATEKLENANRYYLTGIEAKTIAERQDAFNASLSIYQSLNKEYAPISGNGRLYYNIANNYFQLGQYPSALLYYERAKSLMPRDEKIQINLNATKEKLGVQNERKEDFFLSKLFFFQNRFSIPEQLQILFVLIFSIFFLCSLFIWLKPPFFKSIIVLGIILMGFTLINLFYAQFVLPVSAISLKSSYLFMDAGNQYSKVINDPLPPGSKLNVLQVIRGGRWIKVETHDGIIGYVPGDSAEII